MAATIVNHFIVATMHPALMTAVSKSPLDSGPTGAEDTVALGRIARKGHGMLRRIVSGVILATIVLTAAAAVNYGIATDGFRTSCATR